MNKPDKILRVCRPFGEFFRWWLKITRPFHKMKPQEIDVAAKLLEFRYDILKHDDGMKEEDVYHLLITKGWKEMIASELKISSAHLSVLLCNLRKRGFLRDGAINKAYIPDVTNEETYSLQILFQFKKE